MKTLIFIACGGALGAVLRYLATGYVASIAGKGFPYGTLFVNVTGSLLIGFLSVYMLDRLNLGHEWRVAVMVGILGSFTTFSTFSFETLNLLEQGDVAAAMANIAASVLVCLVAVWLGVMIGRQL